MRTSIFPTAEELLVSSIALLTMAASCSPADNPDGASPADNPEKSKPFVRERERMVDEQLRPPRRGIKSERVLQAMATVPRHEFVPDNLKAEAYRDSPLPIGYGQTISQPYIVALMTEKLDPQPNEKILEIGTGSGYQAAILSKLVAQVYSIEIVEPLARTASEALARLGCDNVEVRAGDGYQGWEEHAPFDAIIVTCAPDHIPQPLIEQLREGGRMMIPVGTELGVQELYLLEKKEGEIEKKSVLPVRFVPMTGESEKK